MKPSDFYITSRRFFAVLLPGIVWVSAISLLLFGRQSLSNITATAFNASIIASLMFLGLALSFGMIMQKVSFNVSELIGRRLHKSIVFGKDKHHQLIIDLAYKAVKKRNPEAIQSLEEEGQPLANTSQTLLVNETLRYRFLIMCKRSVGSRSPSLLIHLLDLQDTANFFATLVLPLILLAIALVLRSVEISALTSLDREWCVIGIVVITAAIIAYFTRLLRIIQRDEMVATLEKFLLLEHGLTPDLLKDSKKELAEQTSQNN